MADIHQGHSALGDVAARTLANATKTVPQLRLITPRWLTHMLLSVRFRGINHKAISSYLISLYCSLAVLAEDAAGLIENVEVGKYHDYKHEYAK
jgi:Phage capsid-like protein